MSIVEKASALLEGLTRRDVEHLTTQQRKKLAWALRKIADMADAPEDRVTLPKSGVLFDLRAGHPRHE